MSVHLEQQTRHDFLLEVAARMMAAARTAPKGRGVDNLEMCVVDGDELHVMAASMRRMVDEDGAPHFFLRDAENLEQTQVCVLIGTRIKPLGVPFCGLCGFGDCAGKLAHPDAPCAFNTGDLGIAVGSAASVAMDCRVDNRIMFSAGVAARHMGLPTADCRIVMAIPLSCTAKNPYFDRPWAKKDLLGAK